MIEDRPLDARGPLDGSIPARKLSLWSPRLPTFWPFFRHGVSPRGVEFARQTWLGSLWHRAVLTPWLRVLGRATCVEDVLGSPTRWDRAVFAVLRLALALRANLWAPAPFLAVGKALWWVGALDGYRVGGPCSKRWLRRNRRR